MVAACGILSFSAGYYHDDTLSFVSGSVSCLSLALLQLSSFSYTENKIQEQELNIIGNTKILDFLFSNNVFIPITEDFIRYHKNSEKYDKDITGELKERDATKIKYIINKINKIINLHSLIYEKNPKIKLEVLNLFYKALEYKDATIYNDNKDVKIINK